MADEMLTASDDARADFERFLNENGHPYTLKSSPDPSEFDFVLRFADETYDEGDRSESGLEGGDGK